MLNGPTDLSFRAPLPRRSSPFRNQLTRVPRPPQSTNPLLDASCIGITEAVQALLAAGADKEAKNNDGWTALMCASRYGHTEIVALLKASSTPVCVPVAEAPLHSLPGGGAPQAAAAPACAAVVPSREPAPPGPGRGVQEGKSAEGAHQRDPSEDQAQQRRK